MCEWLETLPSYTLDFLVCFLSIPTQLIFLADLCISLLFMAVYTIELYLLWRFCLTHIYYSLNVTLPSFPCPFTNRCYLSGSSSIKGGRRRRLVALAPADSSRGDGCGDAPAKDAYEET